MNISRGCLWWLQTPTHPLTRPHHLATRDTFYSQGSIDDAISLQPTHIFNNYLIRVCLSYGYGVFIGTEHDVKLLY